MKIKEKSAILTTLFGLGFLITPTVVTAQIIPDRTLPNNTRVNRVNNNFNIRGGTTRGNNLFHSFEQFNIPTNGVAKFQNTLQIENIFGRVTGNYISNIDGLIRANGTANLFLINPNGIIFGTNARLDVGGSFFATTAENVRFGNDGIFSVTLRNSPPARIRQNFPDGLGFGSNPGNIIVRGNGHTVKGDGLFPAISFFQETNKHEGLKLDSGNLTLIGGNILFEGGILRTETGNIEVASVNSGLVSLSSELNTDYQKVSKFSNIELLNRALINSQSGSIILQGENVSLKEGSFIWLSNNSTNQSGNISLDAGSLLELTRNNDFPAAIITDSIEGSGGNILIKSPHLITNDGSLIATRTFNEQLAGNISIISSESVNLNATLPNNRIAATAIVSVVSNDRGIASGQGGNVSLTTNQLFLQNGGYIGTNTLSSGNSGNITLNAKNIDISGRVSEFPFITSLIGSGGAFPSTSGNAGDIKINSEQLTLSDGGLIVASNAGTGKTGQINFSEGRTKSKAPSGFYSRIGS